MVIVGQTDVVGKLKKALYELMPNEVYMLEFF